MCKWIGWVMAVTALALGTVVRGGDNVPTSIKVSTSEGQVVPLLSEDLTGLISRPLVKLQETLDKKFHEGFYSLSRIQAKAGTELVGEYDVVTVPCRLTVYEVSKRVGAARELRVVTTGYHTKPEKAVFRRKIEKLEEDVFIISVERVSSANELNAHLRYMESQGNTIILKGYSTNWNLTALKLKMRENRPENEQGDAEFEKDGLWLVNQLINPLSLMSVRIESE
jgi:hypothetical protein